METNKIIQGDALYSYLAGIIDGEGSIMIRKDTWRMRKSDCKNTGYSPRISVKMNVETIPKLMKKTFGGHYHKSKRIYQSKSGFKNNSIMYCYNGEHKIAFNIIEKLFPYLLIKKKQAKILLELKKLKEKKEFEGGKFCGTPYTKEYISKLEKLWVKVKKLNNSKYLAEEV